MEQPSAVLHCAAIILVIPLAAGIHQHIRPEADAVIAQILIPTNLRHGELHHFMEPLCGKLFRGLAMGAHAPTAVEGEAVRVYHICSQNDLRTVEVHFLAHLRHVVMYRRVCHIKGLHVGHIHVHGAMTLLRILCPFRKVYDGSRFLPDWRQMPDSPLRDRSPAPVENEGMHWDRSAGF